MSSEQLSLDLLGRTTPANEDLADEPPADAGEELGLVVGSGLAEFTDAELVRAELEVLGLDVTQHIIEAHREFLAAVGAVPAGQLLTCRSGAEILVGGVKVATQTPQIRSGRRVVFLTLDDGTGCVDATFFDDVQGPYAATVFHSWLLVVRGVTRRTGPRGVSLGATGAWDLHSLHESWRLGGPEAVAAAMTSPDGFTELGITGSAASRSPRPVMTRPVLVHPTGARMSPYADIKPAGTDPNTTPRKLWHTSPGSSGP